MNTNIHEWRILKIKIEIRVHSCSFVAKMERLNTHTEIAIGLILRRSALIRSGENAAKRRPIFASRDDRRISAGWPTHSSRRG
jgi:hypothetical protein